MSTLSVNNHDDGADARSLARVETTHKHLGTVNAAVQDDGRVNITISDKAHKIAKHLEKRSRARRLSAAGLSCQKPRSSQIRPATGTFTSSPSLNIAVHIVGSRGDVQPFIAIGKVLSAPPYNHRVRICTHPVFKEFVEENGLEFFSIGGDPAVLMAYMVKNPGLMPNMESWKAGEVGKRRADIAEIIEGCWRSCIESGDGMGGESRPHGRSEVQDPTQQLFVADAIIANPPSYAHIHCAEKLGIPLHMIFTMPWSPTQAFPHPLATFDDADTDPHFSNYISYTMMELLAWQGLGDVINKFRLQTLHLDPISPLWGHMLLPRMKVPYTYAWSQALIPKPEDWGSHIDISGFSFLKSAANYAPPADLLEFLNAGPPPLYIGFGSIVVDDPNKLTSMIYGAVKRAGVRALVSKGWGGIGGETPPEGVFLLGNVPHDWLFKHVSGVVHHGGAGTSAIGIALGKPTVVVPFFGDQPFWGAMISKAGAGPEPVPFKKMTEDTLYNSIVQALAPDIKLNVKKMSEKIAGESGAETAAASFQQTLEIDSMRCMICPDQLATWTAKKSKYRLSSLAASVIVDHGLLDISQMRILKHRDWYVDAGPAGPASGIIAAFTTTFTEGVGSLSDYIRNISTIKHKQPVETTEEALPAPQPKSFDLVRVPTHNPVSAGVDYSSQQLTQLAYQMASKSLRPSPQERKKQKEQEAANSWAPVKALRNRRSINRNQALFGEQEVHGKAYDTAKETGRLVDTLINVGLKAPVALFYNIANGFHNIPSFLFNDSHVRRRDNITGVGSGLKVAGKEFTLSLYEAVTGPIVLPYKGAQEAGAAGFGQGLVAGIGGIPFKAGAAAFALPGYALKGVERQLEKRRDRVLQAKVLQIRLQQGMAAFKHAGEAEKTAILEKWHELQKKHSEA